MSSFPASPFLRSALTADAAASGATVLLLIGKFLIGWYISRSTFSQLGGAAASVVVLMLWVYYSSVILFLGAELVKAQSEVSGRPYTAGPLARKIKVVEVDDDG